MPPHSHREAPRVFPTLRCHDTDAMVRWLTDVFGFTVHVVHRHGGVIHYAELAFGSSLLMVGQHRDDEYGRLVGEWDGRRTDSLYVAVDDPDALHDRAKAAGATIEVAPRDTNYGSREFICRDPEGNLWSFGTYWPKAHETPAKG
jgi:uncharacterized glyoxalase superfamily protein PhnB